MPTIFCVSRFLLCWCPDTDSEPTDGPLQIIGRVISKSHEGVHSGCVPNTPRTRLARPAVCFSVLSSHTVCDPTAHTHTHTHARTRTRTRTYPLYPAPLSNNCVALHPSTHIQQPDTDPPSNFPLHALLLHRLNDRLAHHSASFGASAFYQWRRVSVAACNIL
jgi:hypothetical protein